MLTINLPSPPDLDDLNESDLLKALQRIGRAGWRSPKGAAEWLGLPKSEVYQLLAARAIWSFKRGRRRVIPVTELRRYMANQAIENVAPTRCTADPMRRSTASGSE